MAEVITLEEVVNLPFDIAGMLFKVENLDLDDDEKKKVANALRRIGKAYPNIGKSKLVKSLEKSAPILAAGITLATVIGPRVVYVRNVRNARITQTPPAASGQGDTIEVARGDDVRSATDVGTSPVAEGGAAGVKQLFGRDA